MVSSYNLGSGLSQSLISRRKNVIKLSWFDPQSYTMIASMVGLFPFGPHILEKEVF